ncbi:uncharacterized protein J3R85_000911 [Psidium guajava]|nr:uncharacterized protein J3R85_000911 [Psidium guajava]
MKFFHRGYICGGELNWEGESIDGPIGTGSTELGARVQGHPMCWWRLSISS